jgi:hypothetical protein
MSFNGDLQHLSIVDIIQLLHSIRKSGILRVNGRKGESHLVFKDGCIVSASHINNSVRIGDILVDLKIISRELLDQTLLEQKNAARERKPLIVMLVEKGLVNEQDAYKGLEKLIEMTIVEIFTWKKGTFVLDVMQTSTEDEYKYYPDKMSKEIIVDTQSVLMDSLRIYDEKLRDGELTEEEPAEEMPAEEPRQDDGPTLSADDLGLTDFDQLEVKAPKLFTGVEALTPEALHRNKLQELAPTMPAGEVEEFVVFLQEYDTTAHAGVHAEEITRTDQSVVLFTQDELMTYLITSVCSKEDILIFATDEEQDLGQIIARFQSLNRVPVLIFDAPIKASDRYGAEKIAGLLKENIAAYPEIGIVQLASPLAYEFTLHAYCIGVRAVLPRPVREEISGNFARAAIQFLKAFPQYIKVRNIK